MATLPAITVSSKYMYGREKIRLETNDNTGHLLAHFNPATRTFSIETFGVTTPRIGLGKELLRLAEVQARELNARQITATIVDARCLASMTEVFGPESITITKPADFEHPARARAKLSYYIEEPYV